MINLHNISIGISQYIFLSDYKIGRWLYLFVLSLKTVSNWVLDKVIRNILQFIKYPVLLKWQSKAFPLLICFWIFKNQVRKSSSTKWIFSLQKSISKLIFASYTGSKNPVRNRIKIQYVKFDFSKLIFQKSSADQQGDWQA